MASIKCPHCGGELTTHKQRQVKKSGTVNPFGHPFPHARLYNNTLTKFGPQNWSPPMIPNNDLRNYSISGKVPE